MSIAIYTKNEKQSRKWLDILKRELPDFRIEIYPNINYFEAVELLICWKPYTGLIDKFTNLRAIQSLGAGVDHIFDYNAIHASIQVSKIVDDQLTQDMWEHVLGIVMADMKNLDLYREQQKTNSWKPKRYKRIKDTTIGILGLGTIGKYVADQFANLGFEVLGWSRSPKTLQKITSFVGQEGMEQVGRNADYLINILPLTTETRGVFDKDFFSIMKPSSLFINVGRGPHVVDDDLIDCLDSDILRGAALDVFHTEPLPEDHKFWAHPKILVTPHIASLTSIKSVFPQVVENIQRLNTGKPMLNVIDVEKGY